MKRKASHIDEAGDSSPWTSRSPLSDSSLASLDSPDRILKPVPWMMHPGQSTKINYGPNPRTRKRFRDNRPEMSMIHQSTLAKLYNAQKAEQSNQLEADKSFPPSTVNQQEDHQQTPTQKSLHAFFNIRQPQPTVTDLTLSRQQATQHLPELCSDCGNHLSNQSTTGQGDYDMMDVDHHLTTYLEEDYLCASCRRAVCDTCAVRGDQRICLECALSGRG